MNNIKTDEYVFFLSSYLSQWYPSRFVYDGILYDSAEQYMMAQKALLFGDNDTFDKIIACDSPRDCKKLGREVANFNEFIWNQNKESIVYSGNFLKFTQNPQLAQKLILDSYGDLLGYSPPRKFVECNSKDKIWGIGLGLHDTAIYNPDLWLGYNLLGDILSDIANILRASIFEVK